MAEINAKTVRVGSDTVLIIKTRNPNGAFDLRYFVDEGDGTYSYVGEGYNESVEAQRVLDGDSPQHLRWIVDEARRQTITNAERPKQTPRPMP